MPSAASTTLAVTSSATEESPSSDWTTRALCSGESAPRSIRAASGQGRQSGRCSSSSGRAVQRSRIGASVDEPAMRSTRSRNVVSAQWTSSKRRTRGRRRAQVSNSLLIPRKSSSTGYSASESPIAAATGSAATAASCPSSSRTRSRARSGPSSSRIPAAWRTISTIGQNVMPRPYERQRPRMTSASPPTVAANSSIRRDLPTPASATRVTARHLRPTTAASNADRSSSSSASRPTSTPS